jgi:small-conductance mechanosensitive channel
VLKILFWAHGLFKKAASRVFFVSSEDIVRERFSYAKSLFGVVLIGLFLICALVGIIWWAKIWTLSVSFGDVSKWFSTPLFGIGKGTTSPLTIATLLTIVLFVCVGFLAAYAFNRFILGRIFELMVVDIGVQHAVTNIIRYLFVIAASLLALQSAGLGGLITYFYVLILGIGYIIKEPLNDLISYFIILVQRPVKIGDYVQLDHDVLGVVRKITPKSVMLRRRNSHTIVVPNSVFIAKPVMNWSYSRSFIAFPDVMVTVNIGADPLYVKELLAQAVDAHPQILKNPKPVIRFENFKEYGFEFLVRGFISSSYVLEQWDIASDVRLAIVSKLRSNGVEIAVWLGCNDDQPTRVQQYQEDAEQDMVKKPE